VLRLLICVTCLALLAAGTAGAGGSPAAFVALPATDEIVAVDLGSGRVLKRIPVAQGPEDVAAFHDSTRRRDFVLVASRAGGAVTLVDAVTRRVVKVWRGFGDPTDVVVDGLRAYVVDERHGQLVVLDVATRRVPVRIDVGPRPTAVGVGDLAVIAHAGLPSLTLVDVRRRTVTGTVPVAGPVTSVSKQPDTANVYVSFAGSGDLALIDWGRRRTTFRKRVGERLAQVVKDVHLGDRVWVTDAPRGRVVLASARNGRVLRRLGGCPGAHGLAQVGTASVVATCPGSAALALWDTSRWRLRTVRLGDRPAGVGIAILP
jgi:YVTN family beta-propeller protein